MEKKRELSDKFMADLGVGFLKPLLDMVKIDHTLFLQIRNKYINIYYRGGSILKLEENGDSYAASFDKNYFLKDRREKNILTILPQKIANTVDVNRWVENIPALKQAMDISNKLKIEREFQQLVARENNYSTISNETDYFITDIEYTNTNNRNARFDLIAIKWLSESNARKKSDNCRLVLIEMKYGDNAIGGESGIKKHIEDVEDFCNKSNLDSLKQEVIVAFKQLRELGLIRFGIGGNNNSVINLSSEKPEFILLLANHKPSKTKLIKELNNSAPLNKADFKIATSSFMGYGLYNNMVLDVQTFSTRYEILLKNE